MAGPLTRRHLLGTLGAVGGTAFAAGIYQGEEKRPANYKMPQLTALDDHPGEKMPIFRASS